jgi:hypothetical protein
MIDFEQKLNAMKLPDIYHKDGKPCYLDTFRKKMIYITPEETVRQGILRYLVDILKVPVEMILVEEHLSHYGIISKKRADIVINKYDDESNQWFPCAIIECKAKAMIIGDSASKQAIEYADELGCDYVFISNGINMLAAKYDEKKEQYIEIKELPSYKDMLNGKYEELTQTKVPPRIPFGQLKERSDSYVDQEFGISTPKHMLPFLTNLWECFLDETHKLPVKKYHKFELTKDYGNRVLSYGNASGGTFAGVYRSFLIKVGTNDEFVSIGFSKYFTTARPDNMRTCINVAIDNEKSMHQSLQLVVDNQLMISGDKCRFSHSGRIGISNKGTGKIDELKQYIMEDYDKILKNGKIDLGTITNDRLLYLDDPEVVDFVENLISYALVRDKYREYFKANN